MMHESLLISAFGYVDGDSFGGTLLQGGSRPLPPGPFERLRWETFSARPFERFGRLDILTKYALTAVEMLALPELKPGQTRPHTAVVVGAAHGCFSVDLDFNATIGRTGGASPLLFMYTLPSSPLGEIAIRHRVTGPNLCLGAGPQTGNTALQEGRRLIENGEAENCICLNCDAFNAQAKKLLRYDDVLPGVTSGYAYAIYLEPKRRIVQP